MEFITQLIDIFLHLDVYLNTWAAGAGAWLYVGIFAIIFCETGLVITPFLPGDSLLFACGALATSDQSGISLAIFIPVVFVAAALGDFCNYEIGKWIGPKVFTQENSRDLLAFCFLQFNRRGGVGAFICAGRLLFCRFTNRQNALSYRHCSHYYYFVLARCD